MTILSKGEENLLFIHIPKCGGSSIVDTFKLNGYSSELEMRGKPPQSFYIASPQHQSIDALRNMINFDKITKIFAIVRNPYERIKSEYNWAFKDLPTNDRPLASEWIIKSLNMAASDASYSDNHFRPMIEFLDNNREALIFKLEDGLDIVYEYFLQKK